MTRRVTAALAVSTCLAAAGTAGAQDLTIGFVSVNSINPTVASVNAGFTAEAERRGATARVLEVDLADAVGTGISAFDQLIAEGVDAIAFWPLDEQAMQAPVARAQAAGIPVFSHDLYNDGGGAVVSSVIQGRALKATQAARLVCSLAPEGGGTVAYGDFFLPAPTLVFLRETFAATLAECDQPVTIAGIFQNTTDTVEGARGNAEAVLLANQGVFAIDNYNDPTAIGASIAANAAGIRDRVAIMGYNLAPDGIAALQQGRIDVSWDYRGPEVGQALAATMLDYLTGANTEPPQFTVVWPIAYTTATIGDFVPVETRLARIAEGIDLLSEQPDYMAMGEEIPAPPANLPLPSLE